MAFLFLIASVVFAADNSQTDLEKATVVWCCFIWALFDMTTYRLANMYLCFLYYRHLASWPRWPSLLTLPTFGKFAVFLAERETTNQQTTHQDQRLRNLILIIDLVRVASVFTSKQQNCFIQKLFSLLTNTFFFFIHEKCFFTQSKKRLKIFPFQLVTNWHIGPVLNCALAVLISQLK